MHNLHVESEHAIVLGWPSEGTLLDGATGRARRGSLFLGSRGAETITASDCAPAAPEANSKRQQVIDLAVYAQEVEGRSPGIQNR